MKKKHMDNFNRLHDRRLAIRMRAWGRVSVCVFVSFYLYILLIFLSVSTISQRTFNVQLIECVYVKKKRKFEIRNWERWLYNRMSPHLLRLMRFCSFDRLYQPSVVVFVIITHTLFRKSVPSSDVSILAEGEEEEEKKSAWVRKNASRRNDSHGQHCESINRSIFFFIVLLRRSVSQEIEKWLCSAFSVWRDEVNCFATTNKERLT